MTEISISSYALAALIYMGFTLLLLTGWRKRLQGGLLVLATATTAVWASAHALWAGWNWPPAFLVQSLETLHLVVWLVFLFGILKHARGGNPGGIGMRALALFSYALAVALFFLPVFATSVFSLDSALGFGFLGYVLLTVSGLFLVENLYLNTAPEQRWGIKFLCLGVGGIFAFEFYLYAQALLFRQLDATLLGARGAVYALVAPLMGISVARNPQWSLHLFVSRKFAFHTVTLLVAGAYLLLMAAAGYYIKVFGGEWGKVFQVVFLFGAVVVLLALLFSGQARAQLRVFLGKHFFRQHYDYREQWLSFTNALTRCSDQRNPHECVLRCLADVVESPGGVLWLRDERHDYKPVAHWGMPEPEGVVEHAGGVLAGFLSQRQWVINLDEYRQSPGIYQGLELPPWLLSQDQAWLVVPLMSRDRLTGFMVLSQPRARQPFNWELRDLLKTAACQAAGHLVQLQTLEQLSESRQFEGFHRLATVVLHDIKNLIAQQTLVVNSASRHKHKPEFIEDAIEIMEHSVTKMRRLMELLHSGLPQGNPVHVNLRTLIESAVKNCQNAQPLPQIDGEGVDAVTLADRDRLGSAVENIIRNAQEATSKNGYVKVGLDSQGDMAVITVEDNGCGMDADFVRERLFRPFDTTKGDTGMGVGAYDSREYLRSLGGDVEVNSVPGEGSRFKLRLPRVAPTDDEAVTAEKVESLA